ncbi:MAG: polysaccharide biosynthesis/export family protein, partial [Planctomycetales bacterium]|nr:polysaccharide biosynthesis/export family protein [Planctomycetales bacterium]
MDTVWAMEHWPLGVVRATACTLLAAGVAQLLLSKLAVRSPRVHRLAWLLVIAQGWLVMTWTWQVEVERVPAPAVPRAALDQNLSVMIAEPPPQVVATVDDRPATWSLATWSLAAWSFVTTAPATVFAVCWGLGVAVLVGANVRRYGAMVRRLPRGSVPQRADWCDEWQRSTAALGVRRRVVLRISERLGPLLCYLPFAHRVLVPRALWTRLVRTEREAILRHELAHLVRGDLWKSLLVRLVALPQWFNPAVWWAVRRFDEAGEWATDDLARGLTVEEELDYARALVRVAEHVHAPLASTMSAGGGVVTRRIKRLITPRFKEEPAMKKWIVVAVLVGIAAVQLVRVQLVEKKAPPVRPTEWVPTAAQEGLVKYEPDAVKQTTAPRPPAKRPLPDYRVAPPDVLTVDLVGGEPKSDKLAPGDRVIVTATESLPIGHRTQIVAQVDDKGTLGQPGGVLLWNSFEAAGLTVEQCAEKIAASMTNSLGIESPQVTVKRTGSTAFVGQHLVGPDGTLNLGMHGDVYVAGMNLAEVKAAVEEHLSAFYEQPKVAVDVFAYNSQVYYVIVQGNGPGDNVYRFSATGNETVLDAVAQVNGLVNDQVERIWVAQPAPDESGGDRELPVDWNAITSGGSTETNYQLLPGDRLFIEYARAAEVGKAETPV